MRAGDPAAPSPAPDAVVAAPMGKKKRRCRHRRALVRNAEDSRLYNLMLDVNALRSEVQRLEVSRQVIATRTLVVRENQCAVILSTSSRVFRAFRNGYRPLRWTPSEQEFMGSVFDEQVTVDTVTTGRHVLFEQWWLYTELFRIKSYTADSVRVIHAGDEDKGEYIVEAHGAFDGQMTHAAIAVVFPHVLGNRDLEDMLIGRGLHCPLRTRLYFDRSGRITKYLVDVDMLMAISQLVDYSMELTTTLMEHARINEASMIDVEDDFVVAAHDGREDAHRRHDEQSEEEKSSSKLDDDASVDDMTSHRQSIAYILS